MRKLYILLPIVLLYGCIIGPKSPLVKNQPPIITQPVSQIDEEVFKELDTNNDNTLSKEELKKLPVQSNDNHMWAFIIIIGAVALACITAGYGAKMCKPKAPIEDSEDESDILEMGTTRGMTKDKPKKHQPDVKERKTNL